MSLGMEELLQAEVKEIARDLDSIRLRLEGVHQRLPVATNEALMLLGEADMDVATEVRLVVECILNDNIKPAIRDLKAAAEYKGGQERPASPPCS